MISNTGFGRRGSWPFQHILTFTGENEEKNEKSKSGSGSSQILSQFKCEKLPLCQPARSLLFSQSISRLIFAIFNRRHQWVLFWVSTMKVSSLQSVSLVFFLLFLTPSIIHVYWSVYSRCYATTARWVDIPGPFLGNGSVNTFPLLGSRLLIIQQLDYNNGRYVFSIWSVLRCYTRSDNKVRELATMCLP
jgi:hypothetical protein